MAKPSVDHIVRAVVNSFRQENGGEAQPVECSEETVEQVQPSAVEDVRSRVAAYIPGKHGKIGIILPQSDPDPTDLSEIHRTLAEIAVKQAKRKAAQE